MLSDEEKREYEELKSLLYTGTISQYGKRKLIEIIEKQSKEIEELKEKNKFLNWYFENQKENFIHKDKIKAKIEEIKNECKYCDFTDEFCQELLQNNNCTQGNTLKVLQSLLEKD